MVYSASMTPHPGNVEQIYLSKHLAFIGLGFIGTTVAALVSPNFWMRLAPYLFGITIVLLVVVLIPGVGKRVNGAQRWLPLGPLSFQPSETAKITLPLFICWRACLTKTKTTLANAIITFALIAFTTVLILIEPDLGSALFVGICGFLALFLARWPLRDFLILSALIVPASLLLLALKPYQVARIQGFLDAWQDWDAAPYQVKQSLTTLGVGGVWGTGLGKGWQKLSFLPEAHTDFVFAVIGEELGLIGTLSVVALWVSLFVVARRLISKCQPYSFEAVLASTLLLQMVIQAAVNVGVVTALLPPKGISHPFISYGGSNLVVNLVAIGMILSLTRVPPAAPAEEQITESEE